MKSGFLTALAASYLRPSTETGGWVREVVRALRSGKSDALCTLFTSFLASIPYTMRRKEDEPERERYFQYTFYLIFRMLSVYTVYVEKAQSQGRVDCVIETPQYVYIFEFKLDASFSSETGTIGEWQVLPSFSRQDTD